MGEDKHQAGQQTNKKYSEKVVIPIPRNDINLLPSSAQCTYRLQQFDSPSDLRSKLFVIRNEVAEE